LLDEIAHSLEQFEVVASIQLMRESVKQRAAASIHNPG
jgi:hypothetical protein